MRLFNRYYSGYHVLLPLVDLLMAVLVSVISWYLVDSRDLRGETYWLNYMSQGFMVGVLVVMVFYYSDLYAIDDTLPGRDWAVRLFSGFGITCLLLGALSHVIPRPAMRDISFTAMLWIGVGLFLWRIEFISLLRQRKINSKLLIVGKQTIGKLIAEEMHRRKHLGMEVVGFIAHKPGRIALSYGNPVRISVPVFAHHSTIEVVESKQVNKILVEGPESCADFPAQDLVMLRLRGVPIQNCHDFYERVLGKIPIMDLQPGWIVLSEGFSRSRWIFFLKRVLDIVVSMLGLILSAPIALIAAIAIKLDSAGPILYSQERVGQSERVFKLYKFRSMSTDAENGSGPVWAAKNDPRITRVGKVLRKLRIDEIPQMVNVLLGEMSFVGPRPERPYFVAKLKEKIPFYHLRFTLKPGITGWAQISYSYGDSEEDAVEKLQYDLYYVKNISPLFDLQIIFETLKTVLLRRGAQ
jgi:sugar transferase (PEP-CTERM system associated)